MVIPLLAVVTEPHWIFRVTVPLVEGVQCRVVGVPAEKLYPDWGMRKALGPVWVWAAARTARAETAR